MARKPVKPKALYQIKFTYFLIALFALILAANHLNFTSYSLADVAPSVSVKGAPAPAPSTTPTSIASLEPHNPKITSSFTPDSAHRVTRTKSTSTATRGIPYFSAIRVDIKYREELPDAGGGIKAYQNLLYAHSTRAGSAFKKLQANDLFTLELDGTVTTYRIASRQVYTRAQLDSSNCPNNGTSCLLKYVYQGGSTGLALMTCGNGANDDPNYRLVLFAERV